MVLYAMNIRGYLYFRLATFLYVSVSLYARQRTKNKQTTTGMEIRTQTRRDGHL